MCLILWISLIYKWPTNNKLPSSLQSKIIIIKYDLNICCTCSVAVQCTFNIHPSGAIHLKLFTIVCVHSVALMLNKYTYCNYPKNPGCYLASWWFSQWPLGSTLRTSHCYHLRVIFLTAQELDHWNISFKIEKNKGKQAIWFIYYLVFI